MAADEPGKEFGAGHGRLEHHFGLYSNSEAGGMVVSKCLCFRFVLSWYPQY
jgi:hypothetical protein